MMDDPTLSGFSDSTTSGLGNIVGYGGYARRGGYGAAQPPGGWSGGQMPSIGGYGPTGLLNPGAMQPQGAAQGMSAPLQALLSAHVRRLLAQQGQAMPQLPKANFAAMLGQQAQPNGPMGQPQQVAPAPFGQPAQFGGQGPPGGGAPNLKMNSPGP